ncbi:carboxymethylenebutenolidase [Trichodelitschia bisporula]|uniref:Carboxymethylenebutenolidase n=1 Tax=Trichodelitschia bisporula TaxID=703511 RepID=A0A6G1I282_9PEZI|nr:carboxymethylenebutenolidase [Trichodelitschia bisporula]
MANGNFLSFNSSLPQLHITSEDIEFDEETLQHWRDEGFDVHYIPMTGGGKPYRDLIMSLGDKLPFGGSYGIIAYGEAAALCLDIASKPLPHCAALICYYPSTIPKPNAMYPTQLNLVVHVTESQDLKAKFPVHVYAGVEPGFAEHDLDEFNAVAAGLAWTRSLAAVRKGFKREADLETVRGMHAAYTLVRKDADATIALMATDPHVNYVPTMTGGVGKRALQHFYDEFFCLGIPPDFRTRLISRTVGVDRVVDEMVISFTHTIEMPWILPAVPPTGKAVEVGFVSIVAIRGGKLVHEHIYWDQASVLMQIGALDPKQVPKALSSKGCKRLPVAGRDAARKLLDMNKIPSNSMIPDW